MAVIQNEVGEVGLDGKLLDTTVTEIDEGCVCCSLAGNLKRAVQGILENFSPIGRGGDAPEGVFSIIESLMARPVA